MPKTSRRSKSEHLITVAPGAFIFRQGDLGTEMYVIHSGEVEILLEGDPPDSVALLEKGDFFGEMSLLEHVPRSASARARSGATLLKVDGAMFTDLVRSQPEFAVCIMRRLSRRVRELDRRLALHETVEERSPETPPGKAIDAVLVHPGTGMVFPLTLGRPALVGRRDPISGAQPQVDLSAIDTERSCSRRHARIFRSDGKLMVSEELGATNGTFLNEKRLAAEVAAPVSAGDKLRFGLVTLELEIR